MTKPKVRHTVTPRTLSFVFNDFGEVLLIQRGEDKFDAGMVNGLGGHIEKGEDVLKAAEREIIEESGVKLLRTELAGILHDTNFFGKDIMLFITKSFVKGREFVDSIEGKLIWVNVDEIDNYNIYEDIKPIIEKILEGEKEIENENGRVVHADGAVQNNATAANEQNGDSVSKRTSVIFTGTALFDGEGELLELKMY